ncbi:DUF3265 domain-containing protein, partial [Vibrio anguillarum]|nr:DUF3265 domain-containing protein [Vibrio anguillarum]
MIHTRRSSGIWHARHFYYELVFVVTV